MTDLGTLKSDNSGTSSAKALSADGSTVAGQAVNDAGDSHAFLWTTGGGMTDLGTLKSDNSGSSWTKALSADGSTVAGEAVNDAGDSHAFRWSTGGGMTDLGTLRSDNSGTSWTKALSADGSTVAGNAVNDAGDYRAVLWKISKPYLKQSVKIVDVDNSRQAMLNTASKAQRMLALYQGALSGLTDARCQLGAESYCLGAFTQYDRTQSNNMTMAGLFGAVRLLPSEKLTAGASVNLSGPVNLVSGYDTRVSSKPGLGIFTRWQDNPDGAGLSVDVSGAFIQQDVTISREQLSHTEAGKGDAKIKGWQAKGTVSWGIKAGEDTLISPVAGLTWQDVSRSAYTETQNAEFTAGYGKMGNKSTSLNTGLEITHKTGSNVVLSAGAGVDINLSHQRERFTGNIDYIGSFAYDNGKTRDVKPYVQAGVSVEVTRNSVVRVSTGWQETDYHKDNVQTALSYSFLW